MADVLTGSIFLLLLSLAVLLGYWIGSRSYACATVFTLPPLRPIDIAAPQAALPANRLGQSFGRWLARVIRATCAPSSDDASALCDAPSDPDVNRTSLAHWR